MCILVIPAVGVVSPQRAQAASTPLAAPGGVRLCPLDSSVHVTPVGESPDLSPESLPCYHWISFHLVAQLRRAAKVHGVHLHDICTWLAHGMLASGSSHHDGFARRGQKEAVCSLWYCQRSYTLVFPFCPDSCPSRLLGCVEFALGYTGLKKPPSANPTSHSSPGPGSKLCGWGKPAFPCNHAQCRPLSALAVDIGDVVQVTVSSRPGTPAVSQWTLVLSGGTLGINREAGKPRPQHLAEC